MNEENVEIQYVNRQKGALEVEKVYGDKMVKALYQNPIGRAVAPFVTNRYLSKFYGLIQSNILTQLKVPGFVEKFNIDLNEYEPGSVNVDKQTLSYKNFNEFFIRKFKDGKRKFNGDENSMPAFSEARYFGHSNVNDELKVPVKGKLLTAKQLLNNSKHAEDFEGGAILIARLCPVDYHRYHYPDDGKTLDSYTIKGQFHSVNPVALKMKPDIFMANERRVSILETKNFGKLAYIEVGAICVGKIVQSFDESNDFKRGDEKGYFLFGGSTVIVLGQKGKWGPSSDIIENTEKGLETYIQLGDEVAVNL